MYGSTHSAPRPSGPAPMRAPITARPAGFPRFGQWMAREEGTMTVFGLFVFLAMLMVAGIAVDVMRIEHERVRMQGTSDRAVIAATMLRENVSGATPEQIVQAYFAAEGLDAQLEGRIRVEEDGTAGRVVTINPAGAMATSFMRLAGVDNLQISTSAQAVEALSGVSIEIVMVLDISGSMGSNRRIQNLRQAASEMVEALLGDTEPGEVAITLVPYTQFVVPPAGMINHFANLPSGGNACIDFSNWSDIRNSLNAAVSRMYCTTDSWLRVRPYMHDAAEAVSHIQALRDTYTTQIDLGVRFGALFFDPSIRPVIEQMVSNGEIHENFAGRPYDWNHQGVVRAMILMTDGENCCGERYTRSVQDQNTLASCTALKNEGILVYAVAFEAPQGGVDLMQSCASSPNHFFNTSGAEIVEVFAGIGTHIQTQSLRLTR